MDYEVWDATFQISDCFDFTHDHFARNIEIIIEIPYLLQYSEKIWSTEFKDRPC